MTTNYTAEGYIGLNNVSFTDGGEGTFGSTLEWDGFIAGAGTDVDITDFDDDGNLDTGYDQFNGVAEFTGYTITGTNGYPYPVFSVAGYYYVAVDIDVPAGNPENQTLISSTGTSNSYVTQTSGTIYLCFASGTRIAVPGGERPVESLIIGEYVLTADGRAVPVLWLGRQTLHTARLREHSEPVRIRAGALGNGVPHSDLTVTADHGMLVDGMIVNAAALVNGHSIAFVPYHDLPKSFTVYHIETEAHDVILANGAPSESIVDAVTRQAFDNYDEYLALYGVERIIPEMRRPRVSSRRLLPQAIKDRLGIAEAPALSRAG